MNEHLTIIVPTEVGAEAPTRMAELAVIQTIRTSSPMSVAGPLVYAGFDRRDGCDWHRWTVTVIPAGEVIR